MVIARRNLEDFTARSPVGDSNFIGTFVVIPMFVRHLIIGIHFMRKHDAVINNHGGLVSLCTNGTAPESTGNRSAHLRIAHDDFNLPPRACILVSAKCGNHFITYVFAEVMSTLLLDCGIAIARSLVTVEYGDHQSSEETLK